MKLIAGFLMVILFSLSGCCGTKRQQSTFNAIQLQENNRIIVHNDDVDSVKTYCIESMSVEVSIQNIEFFQLDTFATTWNLDSGHVVKYIQTRYEIDANKAKDIITKNYHPFCVIVNVINDGIEEHLIITPSGVGISYNHKFKEKKFYNTDGKAYILPSKNYFDNWHVKILSKQKYYDEPEHDNELYQWYLKWDLTVTRMNEYFNLCRWEPFYLLNAFQNIECGYFGEALYNNEFYSYRLECSGMTIFHKYNKQEDEVDYGFGCFDKKGEKYIFEAGLLGDA